MKGLSVILGLFALMMVVQGRVVSGSVKTKDMETVLGQFTFTNGHVQNTSSFGIWYNYQATKFGAGETYIRFYCDTDDSWFGLKEIENPTCDDYRNFAKGEMYLSVEYQGEFHLNNYQRPHIWYVVLVNCPNAETNEFEEVAMDYYLHFVNIDGTEVGFDEEGMLPLNVFYMIFFFVFGGAMAYMVIYYRNRNALHPIIFILACGVALMALSTFLIMIHWAAYANNGTGVLFCKITGQLFNGLASILFAGLLVLIASGWGVTYDEIRHRKSFIGVFGVYLIFYLILFICCNVTGRTSGSTQFVYATGALLGFVIVYVLFCWLGVFGFFAFRLYQTFRADSLRDRRFFYVLIGIVGTVWFLIPALTNFISLAVDEWFRPRVVDALSDTITFVGMIAIAVVLSPYYVERFFRLNKAGRLINKTPAGEARPTLEAQGEIEQGSVL